MCPTARRIKILIADDSVVYRSQIRAALSGLARAEVVGATPSGKLALERLSQVPADLLILDLEMPDFDGIETLKEIKRRGIQCKTLLFSSGSKRGAEVTFEALRHGAMDFILKPGASSGSSESPGADPADRIREVLIPKIQSLFPEVPIQSQPRVVPDPVVQPAVHWDLLRPRIIVIGSSTGGPNVLERIFSEVKGPISCPIVIVQHMPPVFTATLAQRISSMSGIPAREARDGAILEPNSITIAPGDYHLELFGNVERTVMKLNQGPKVHSVRPAVDPLFESASKIFKERCLGFVLTGMGSDGKSGAQAVKDRGGSIVIQNEASCVVFGMPGAVHAAGAFDRIADPAEIIRILKEKASFETTPSPGKPAGSTR